jgi:hypothetical protein
MTACGCFSSSSGIEGDNHSCLHTVIASAAKQSSLSAGTVWIAHMGIWCVKVDVQLFVRLQPAFRPDRRVFQMARTDRVKVGPEGRREAA